jgi:hypothetical protein
MMFSSRLRRIIGINTTYRPRTLLEQHSVQPRLEALEDRLNPSAGPTAAVDPPPPPHAPPPPAHQPPKPDKPDKTGGSSSGSVFSESDVLVASKMDTTNGTFDVWYSDEHALALGVRQVVVKTSTGTTVTNYDIATMGSSNPSSAHNPATGATGLTGDQSGTDPYGWLLTPSLYITDNTTNTSTTVPITPTDIFGTWKSFVKTVDYTRSATSPTVTMTADQDPARNGWNLGSGADAPPSGIRTEGYTAEVRWDLNSLYQQGVLKAGDNYTFTVIVHDGDQNKAGGDAGQAIYNVGTLSGPSSSPTTPPSSLSGSVFDSASGAGIANVQLTLTGTTDSGQTVSLYATTDANGAYVFTGLQAGTYTITQTLPQGMVDMSTNPGTVDGTADGSVPTQGTIDEIFLLSGKQGVEYDFYDSTSLIIVA